MTPTLSRRHLLLATLGTVATACAPSRVPPPPDRAGGRALADIEARAGGRLGVFALDTGSGRSIAHRPDERFAMCSTFKWVLAATVLAHADQRELALDDRIPYGEAALLEYAPVTRAHVAEGSMSIDALAEAAVTRSDNTAANLLLGKVGGPGGVTRFIRATGDSVSRLDREEPALNSNEPGDLRDTTTPRAMVGLMQRVLCGDALSVAGRERLCGWLRACETGKERLRAGLPPDWAVGDKTGSGERGAVNDVAIAWPNGRAPILVAAYTSDGEAGPKAHGAVHADVGRVVARVFSQR